MSTLSDYEHLFQKLAATLPKEKWFDEHWLTDTGFFPNAEQPKSVFIQLFRDSWFNEQGKGIHLESWMTNADVSRGTASVVLHIESSKERTGINGKALVKALFASAGHEISEWEGYQMKETYTMQPFIKKMTVTPDTFVSSMRFEFSRLAGIADAIDDAIVVARA